MPLYTYICPTCLVREVQFRRIARRDELSLCSKHRPATEMLRQIEAPMVKGDYPGYDCPVTGKWIEGRRAHEANLAKHGARVLEPGETAAHTRSVAREDAALEKALGETVESTIHNMPSRKREQLAVELQTGADVSMERATGKVAQNG